MSITVIIPTIGRASLAAAVQSALEQTEKPIEILVCLGKALPPESITEFLPNHPSIKIVANSSTHPNGNTARNAGIRAATGEYLAFLDDDDIWFCDKLKLQLGVMTGSDNSDVCATSIGVMREGKLSVEPFRFPKSGERMASYILIREALAPKPHILQTSTLMVRKSFALRNMFNEELKVHQDWDWLIRAEKIGGKFVYSSECTALYAAGTFGNTAKRTSWKDSWDWVSKIKTDLTETEYGEALVGLVSSRALYSKDYRRAFGIIFFACKNGRPTFVGVLAALLRIPLSWLSSQK